jgi:hypothetical protein
VPQTLPSQPEAAQEVTVSVVATVNLTNHTGKIRFVTPLANGRPSGLEPESPVALRAKRDDGGKLQEFGVQAKLFSELSREADREGLVDAVIRISTEARALELLVGGTLADSLKVGGSEPPVRGVQRVAAEGKELAIALALDRELAEGHSFSIQVSSDHGRTWQTMGVGLREPIVTIDRTQFKPGEELQVRVLATNGLSSSIVTSEPFRV